MFLTFEDAMTEFFPFMEPRAEFYAHMVAVWNEEAYVFELKGLGGNFTRGESTIYRLERKYARTWMFGTDFKARVTARYWEQIEAKQTQSVNAIAKMERSFIS